MGTQEAKHIKNRIESGYVYTNLAIAYINKRLKDDPNLEINDIISEMENEPEDNGS